MDANEAGFTLVEVLVALTISALLMAAAYRGLALGTRGMRVSDVEARLLDVAKTELSRVGIETPLTEGRHAGQSGGIDWTVSVTPYVVPNDATSLFGEPRAYWVEVETRAQGRPAKRLTTLKLNRSRQ
jgi:prepilin-type N-terminal cleavage/methylation domain-containing protein